MTKHTLMLVTFAFILLGGAIAASAQQSSSTPMMQHAKQVQHDANDEDGPGTKRGEWKGRC
jgi:hypothetical protein